MYDSIPKGRGADLALFWLADVEMVIWPWLVAALAQFTLQFEQVTLQLILERGDLGLGTLAASSLVKRSPEVIERIDLFVKMIVCFH